MTQGDGGGDDTVDCENYPQYCNGNDPKTGDELRDLRKKTGGGGGGSDCGNGEICYVVTTEDLICGYILDDCDTASTILALTGTGLDGLAFLINAAFGSAAAASLIVALLGDPAGWVAYGLVFNAYQVVAPYSTAIGWAGFAVWALQGMVTGENQLGMAATYTNDGKLKEITMFGSVAQDTIFSLLNDGLQTNIKEPIVGTIWSGVGVGYDLVRNPFNPSSPFLPTIIQPTASVSYNFETNSTSFDFSWFPTNP